MCRNSPADIDVPGDKTTEHSIEVSADALGVLIVGPVQIDTKLDDRTKAMVTFRKQNRYPETMRFASDNVSQAQFFEAGLPNRQTL